MRDNIKMSKQKTHNSNKESGQVIVLMGFLITILVAALGLALDGGGLYFLARDVQNAVDAAVLAGSYAQCTGGDAEDAETAAERAATLNGFDNNGTDNWVTVSTNADGELEVTIRALKPSFFIQIIRPGDLNVQRKGIGFCSPAIDTSMYGGVSAIGDCGCGVGGSAMIQFSGSNLDFYGGFASNGVIDFTQGNQVYDLVDSPLNSICGTNGGSQADIYDDGDGDWSTTGDVTPSTDTIADLSNTLDEPLGDPLGLNREDFSAVGEFGLKAINTCPAGQTCHWTQSTNGKAYNQPNKILDEGIHYASGDISIGSNDQLRDTNGNTILEYTFVSPGEIDISGQNILGTAGSGINGRFKYYPASPGILAFSSRTPATTCAGNSAPGIDVSGSINVEGIFYAPRSHISFSSNSVQVFLGALLGETVEGAMSNGTFIYTPELLPPKPPEVGIEQ